MALRHSKVLFYKAASVSLTVLENAQYYCDAILQLSYFWEKQEHSGEGFTAVIHMKSTRKQHIYLHCEKGLKGYTAYIITAFK